MPGPPAKTTQPVVALLDLLGHRWTLRVLWELRDGALTFRSLRAAAGDLSPTVLNARLSELRAATIVELSDEGYQLTSAGRELAPVLLKMHGWAKRHRAVLI
jgi:DNA-binding HxlR family transcriptional regulator